MRWNAELTGQALQIAQTTNSPVWVAAGPGTGQTFALVRRPATLARVFHRTSLIEKWGRGTNRVVAVCQDARLAPPEFAEITGAAVVTFRVRVGRTAESEVGSEVESRPKSRPESSTSPVPVQSQSLEERILASLKDRALPVSIISKRLGQKRVSGHLKVVLKMLLSNSLTEFTIPDKPNSRLLRYRLTPAGERALRARTGRH